MQHGSEEGEELEVHLEPLGFPKAYAVVLPAR